MNKFRLAVVAAVAMLAHAPVRAQYSSTFESLQASTGGTPLTGQDAYYLPAGSSGFLSFTYSNNTLGVPQNPGGGSVFVAGTAPGAGTTARAQRDIDYGCGAGIWTAAFDVCALFTGTLPATQNLGSFSVQPNAPGSQAFVALARWSNPAQANSWRANYTCSDAAGTQISAIVPDPFFQNLSADHWYRWETDFDLTTNRITEVRIRDLATGATHSHSPTDWYLRGGAAGGTTPTALRFAAGGSTAGNTMCFDNVRIEAIPYSAGPVVGTQIAFREQGGLRGHELLTKRPGFLRSRATPFTPCEPATPDFRFSSILQGQNAVRVAAMSIGREWIAANNGRENLQPGEWAILLFTVDPDSQGAVGPVRLEQCQPDGAGGDVFSYVLCGSDPELPPPFVDRTERALDSTELGLGGALPHIRALDAHIPLYELDTGLREPAQSWMANNAPLPTNPNFYFTVEPSTLGAVPAAWWGSSLPSAGTVFCSSWNGVVWSPPRVFIAWNSVSANPNTAIDGLAIDERHGRMLFSTDDALRTQIEFVAWTPGTKPATGIGMVYPWVCPGENDGDVPVATKIGGGQGIGDFCLPDPGNLTSSVPAGIEPWCFGVPRVPQVFAGFPANHQLGVSAYRTCGPNGEFGVSTFLTGFGPGGEPAVGGGAAFAWAGLWLEVRSGGGWVRTGPILDHAAVRVPPITHAGDPQEWTILVPQTLPLLPDVRFVFVWAVLDPAGFELTYETVLRL
ncbi:MAG: hypothetical protein R3F56_21160 [Planctomycetota bacterium]